MQPPRLSPSAYRKVTLVALMALAFIVVTGASVRLTGSGLGCPDWPTCSQDRLVAVSEYHERIESVNRTITGFVSIAVIVAVLGSLARQPRRRDLTWLSGGLVAGVVAQIFLGGLTVIFHLTPPIVMAHFLVSMVLIANAVVLHHRAGEDDGGSTSSRFETGTPAGELKRLANLLVVACAVTLFLGTVVTSAGPHGGDADVARLDVPLGDVARLHGGVVMVFLGLTLVLLRKAMATTGFEGATRRRIVGRAEVLLAVLVAQAAVGYTQYFTGVPVLLVGIHVAGACAVWVATLRLWLVLARVDRSAGDAGRATGPAGVDAETAPVS